MKGFFSKRKNIVLFILLGLCIIINLVSRSAYFVEAYYTSGIYITISKALREAFGRLPFSLGDILYAVLIVFLLFRIIRFFRKLFKRKTDKKYLSKCFYTIAFLILFVYFLFNMLWGINYNRLGIAHQLKLTISKRYSTKELDSLAKDLIVKANANRLLLGRKIFFPNNKTLYNEAVQSYRNAENIYPFLQYQTPSIKSSIFNLPVTYLGTSGYYNPFTGEAQVNTMLPKFTLPYVVCHEMAHQLGYAAEDEANFAGYLSASSSFDPLFKYSVYLDLYLFANRELFFRDSSAAKKNYAMLDTLVKIDLHEYKSFGMKYENPIEKITSKLYSQYLKANQQPQGIETYSNVTAWLIAYKNKYEKL
ncbi:MAG: DUF3810 domain-containing protein [Arachidicoccus sp.]|nr:DUF3810 domain-containing protein [Arachidicoccus sp.]